MTNITDDTKAPLPKRDRLDYTGFATGIYLINLFINKIQESRVK